MVKNKRTVFGISNGSSFGSSGLVRTAPFTGKLWGDTFSNLGRLLPAGVGTNIHSVHHHNEQAFRYLLENETKRSKRSGHPFNGLLLYFARPEGIAIRMDSKVTSKVLPTVSGLLRETDYIGWYRDNHILGVVLTASGDNSTREVFFRIEQRFVEGLRGRLRGQEFSSLRCHFFRSQELEDIESLSRVVSSG